MNPSPISNPHPSERPLLLTLGLALQALDQSRAFLPRDEEGEA